MARSIFTAIAVIVCMLNGAKGDLLPAIVWDPSNPMFSCDNPEILVRLNDKVNIVCPNRGINTQEQNDLASSTLLYESASFLCPSQKSDYDSCDSSAGLRLLRCDKPSSLEFTTIPFRKYASSSNVPTFTEGKTHYLIGTSYRYMHNLDKKLGGSCRNRLSPDDNLLRLKIRVCTQDEIHVYKNCTVCSTVDCYAKACMNCEPKRLVSTSDKIQMGSKCYTVTEEQRCIHRKTAVAQKFEKMVETPCTGNRVGTNRITNNRGRVGITSASTSARGDDGTNANRTIVYAAVASCFGCLIVGILIGILVTKRNSLRRTPSQEHQSRKPKRTGGTVSFTNGGFVTKDGSLEIQAATIGSPSKVYGNFD